MTRAMPATGSDPRRSVAGVGRVVLWKGGSVWMGRDTGQVQPHSHHAIQITLAPARRIRIRGAAEDAWHETSAAIVMPDRPHLFDGCGHTVAMVFVEPETLAGHALLARHGQRDVSLLDDEGLASRAAALHAVFEARGTDGALVDAARGLIEHLAGAPVGRDVVDPRIGAVLERIREHPDAELDLAQAAAIAHLSPSRFRHLFVAQTGISFRAYLLWARVGYAVVRGLAGGSWTEAAQQAGFADSAHLSRTCRRMFGIAPTMLLPEGKAPRLPGTAAA
ncbi:helix-turn-helix transcriptional regulator [Frateuria terrea]|uniref:AraC-type DNA-binding protein n=1 Tax=Frateuria terrea TaxID=529704 RepID=A0A1H6YSV4_9GAMM|nr:AraC family transcriptional regulator [Frateuria terrea]SEJ40390.1 AraC-type DNA-binding protein [Frateuria terrea]SFP75087.1 AraC-type DNA-binding protein [Frateuria terrea]